MLYIIIIIIIIILIYSGILFQPLGISIVIYITDGPSLLIYLLISLSISTFQLTA